MTRGRLWVLFALAGVLVIGGLTLWARFAAGPRSPVDSGESARQLLSAVRVSATVGSVSLAAAGASADFGIDEGVRRVNVRIVQELGLEVRFESDREVVLESAPKMCLVGPFWNPLDAGLSDRCWGDPDLQDVLAAEIPTDDAGRLVLLAGRQIVIDATLRRGDVRCDYSPGEWHLEVAANPVVDGAAVGRTVLDDVIVQVPFEIPGTLELLPPDETRVCSYPAAVYRRQGEPPVSSP